MDTPPSAPSPSANPKSSPSTPSVASEQARIRRERREAKIRAGGSARLSKITGVGGRPSPDAPPPSLAAATTPSPALSHSDPEEVDISSHFSPSQQQHAVASSNDLTPPQLPQTLPQLDFPISARTTPNRLQTNTPPPFPRGTQLDSPQQDDPMAALLQQMIGGTSPDGASNLPPGFAEMMASFSGTAAPPSSTSAAQAPKTKWLFPILHFLFALSLGLYCAMQYPLNGSKAARLRGAANEETTFSQLLPIFLTVELALQSTRFVLNRGAAGAEGEMGALAGVMGFLPPVYRGWVEMAVRYAGVWKRVVTDVGIVLFCLGIGGWVRANSGTSTTTG